MKKSILILIVMLVIFCGSLSAQEAYQKGSWLVDGQAYYNRSSGDAYYDTDLLNLDLAVGRAVSDGLFIGGTISLASISTDTYDDTDWRLGTFLKYYFSYSEPNEISSDKPLNPFFGIAL